MEHLPDGGHLALEEDGHQPVAVVRHGVQEPPASCGGAVELFGEQLHPLDNVELLFGVDERLEEEGGGQLGGQQGDVLVLIAGRYGHYQVLK